MYFLIWVEKSYCESAVVMIFFGLGYGYLVRMLIECDLQ